MEAIKLCRLYTTIMFLESRINLNSSVVTGSVAYTPGTVTFPSLTLVSLYAFSLNTCLHGVAANTFALITSAMVKGVARFGSILWMLLTDCVTYSHGGSSWD